MARLDIAAVNNLSVEQFEWVFGNAIELCSDAAVRVERKRPFNGAEEIVEAFHEYLDNLNGEGKETILKLHPDLAGRLAAQGQLTKESTEEQRSAGLDNLTFDQKEIINSTNERYKAKFGFPFIICARENKVQSIIEGLKRRYNNTRETEISIAIEEVKKICKLRVQDIVE